MACKQELFATADVTNYGDPTGDGEVAFTSSDRRKSSCNLRNLTLPLIRVTAELKSNLWNVATIVARKINSGFHVPPV